MLYFSPVLYMFYRYEVMWRNNNQLAQVMGNGGGGGTGSKWRKRRVQCREGGGYPRERGGVGEELAG